MAHIFRDLVYQYNRGKLTSQQFCQTLDQLPLPEYDQSKYGHKIKRVDFGPLWQLWQPLVECETIQDQNLIYSDCFIFGFYKLIWSIVKITGYSTENLEVLLPTMVATIRNITNEQYLRVNCNNPTPYYCGRALIVIPINSGHGPLLLFDTVPPDDMNPVTVDRYNGILDTYVANNGSLDHCSSSKRLQKEMQTILKLPFVMGLSHYVEAELVVLDIDTKCGCKVRLTIADCNKYPYTGPELLYINDIPYTPLYGKEWHPSMKLTDLIVEAHTLSQCRHFAIV